SSFCHCFSKREPQTRIRFLPNLLSMNETLRLQPAAATGNPNRTQLLNGWIPGWIALATCWALLFNQLRVDWSINPQYYFGWFVPLLALGLFHFRWTTRPDPVAPQAVGGIAVIAGLSLAALLPIRLIEEANPEWRLIQWTHALEMVLLSLCAL